MESREQPGHTRFVRLGEPCPLCGTRPVGNAGQDVDDVAEDFGEQHRCTPRVQLRARG